MDRLKAETADRHRAVEALPFFRALAAGEIPLAGYAGWLARLLPAQEALDRRLREAAETDPDVRSTSRPWHFRADDLRADLAFLGVPFDPPGPAARRLRDRVGRARTPGALLGTLYVFEGSRLGGAVLSRRLGPLYGLDGVRGMRYAGGETDKLFARWTEFRTAMNGLRLGPEGEEETLRAARDAFDGLADVAEELERFVPSETAVVA